MSEVPQIELTESHDGEDLRDDDRDALHILPLCIMPLETPTLRRARLIKNMHLDSVVELFFDPSTGSGQVKIPDIPTTLDWPEDKSMADLDLLRRLAGLASYDVYSLRILLRDMNIPVTDARGLQLSPAKIASLDSYMVTFTRPLVATVFGGKNVDQGGAQDLVQMFREVNSAELRGNLETIAEKLQIEVTELPRFLEDCGDIFLALSYFRQCLDDIKPVVATLLDAIVEIRGNRLLSESFSVMLACKEIEATIVRQMATVGGQVEKFEELTGSLWDDVSAERFQEVKTVIQGYHTSVGGLLCALTVKMRAWATRFPNPKTGGVERLATFLVSDMKLGLEKVRQMDGMAPI